MRVLRNTGRAQFLLGGDDLGEPLEEPRVEPGDLVDPRHAKPVTQRLSRDQQPVGGGAAQRIFDLGGRGML